MDIMKVQNEDKSNLQMAFSGRLDIDQVALIWKKCMDLQEKYLPEMITVDAKEINYCDGSGIALFFELQKRQRQSNKKFIIKNFPQEFSQLLETITTKTETKITEIKELHPGLTDTVGKFSYGVLENIYENIIFIGSMTYQIIQTVLHPKTIRWKDMWKVAENVGPDAIPLIALIGFLMGFITAFQSAIPLEKFGAQVFVANLVGISLVRELGPLMTDVLLAGRTASSFAAEIGTMKVNQEIDALKTMGLNSIKFLAIPRVIATTMMTPLLNVFLILFGLIGCGVVMNTLGFNLEIYLQQLEKAIKMGDFIGGMVKTFVFGVLISGIGCLHGLKTKMNASAVGYSTTQSVVSGIIIIIFVDGIFAYVYYVLGV